MPRPCNSRAIRRESPARSSESARPSSARSSSARARPKPATCISPQGVSTPVCHAPAARRTNPPDRSRSGTASFRRRCRPTPRSISTSGEAAGLVGEQAERAARRRCRSTSCGMPPTRSANPTEVHRQYAAELVAAMPPPVVDAAHEPYGARALIFASLLDENADIRAAQLRALEKPAEPHVFELTLQAGARRRTNSTCAPYCRWSI